MDGFQPRDGEADRRQRRSVPEGPVVLWRVREARDRLRRGGAAPAHRPGAADRGGAAGAAGRRGTPRNSADRLPRMEGVPVPHRGGVR